MQKSNEIIGPSKKSGVFSVLTDEEKLLVNWASSENYCGLRLVKIKQFYEV